MHVKHQAQLWNTVANFWTLLPGRGEVRAPTLESGQPPQQRTREAPLGDLQLGHKRPLCCFCLAVLECPVSSHACPLRTQAANSGKKPRVTVRAWAHILVDHLNWAQFQSRQRSMVPNSSSHFPPSETPWWKLQARGAGMSHFQVSSLDFWPRI